MKSKILIMLLLINTGCGLTTSWKYSGNSSARGALSQLPICSLILRDALKELNTCLDNIPEGKEFKKDIVDGEIKIENGYLFISQMKFADVKDRPRSIEMCIEKAANLHKHDMRRKGFRDFDPVNKTYLYKYSGNLQAGVPGKVWLSGYPDEAEEF